MKIVTLELPQIIAVRHIARADLTGLILDYTIEPPKMFYSTKKLLILVEFRSYDHRYRNFGIETKKASIIRCLLFGAGNETRTRYLHLGKVALYRMSYARTRNI